MTKKLNKSSNKDVYICENCGHKNKHRSPYMYNTRTIDTKKRIQIVDKWNIPHSTGIHILADDDVTAEEVEEFAKTKVAFPFWKVHREGVLWTKNTWDD